MLARFYQRLAEHAARHPTQIALREAEQALTYAELMAMLKLLISDYQQHAEQRFALEASNSIRWVLHDLALLFAQRVCIPIPPFFTESQRQGLLTDSGAQVLIDETGRYSLATTDALPELPQGTLKITYTSGSTGDPKGVCLSGHNMLNTVVALADRLSEVQVKRHLVMMPLAILLENIAGVYLSLWLGHEVQLSSSQDLGLSGSSTLDATQFFGALKQYKPESLILTPALVTALVHGVRAGLVDAAWFKLLAVGGARVPEALEQQATELKLPLVQGYGLSEFSSVVAFNAPLSPVIGAVGQPLKHATVAIVNGEIAVSGNCMLGYLNQPGTWYPDKILTGDYGEFDAFGNLRILGRKKNTIVTNFGRNIDPEWLEALLFLQPGIAQAAVFGGEEQELTALLVPHVVSHDSPQTALQAMRHAVIAVNKQLPDYAQIHAWHLLEQGFSVANKQLTGTGRLRRETIASEHAHLLLTTTA